MSSGLPWSSFLIYIFHLCFMGRIPADIRSTKKLDVNNFQVASVHLSLVTFLLQSLRQGVSGVKSLREWVMLSARSLMHDFQAFSEWFGNLDLDSPPDLSQLSLFFVTFFFIFLLYFPHFFSLLISSPVLTWLVLTCPVLFCHVLASSFSLLFRPLSSPPLLFSPLSCLEGLSLVRFRRSGIITRLQNSALWAEAKTPLARESSYKVFRISRRLKVKEMRTLFTSVTVHTKIRKKRMK